ncbi:hypothetical protein HGRIS_010503 [Hohenbuehelia grisea]|uniref:G domain-containing protein n=1 Tax=Hohenbuehelia grisea TaxID=104357 RepID=A0ABR3IX71_9AGAR
MISNDIPWEDISSIKKKCERFRILVIGKANAGKTTLLQKVCNTTESPVIYNPRGDKIGLRVVLPSKRRGQHKIEDELVFAGHDKFIFHDSQGFEAGSDVELNVVKKFIKKRSKEPNLADRLHAVWFCIPTDSPRILLEHETSFFHECDPGKVPVIAIFTKFDYRHRETYYKLLDEGRSCSEAKKMSPRIARQDFENMYKPRLYERRYPPCAHIFLRDMQKSSSTCEELVKVTASSLDDQALQSLFVSAQLNCIDLCVEYAIRHTMSHETRRRSTFGLNVEEMKDIVYNCLIWFPSSLV